MESRETNEYLFVYKRRVRLDTRGVPVPRTGKCGDMGSWLFYGPCRVVSYVSMTYLQVVVVKWNRKPVIPPWHSRVDTLTINRSSYYYPVNRLRTSYPTISPYWPYVHLINPRTTLELWSLLLSGVIPLFYRSCDSCYDPRLSSQVSQTVGCSKETFSSKCPSYPCRLCNEFQRPAFSSDCGRPYL